ncbi:MAG TPA: hypothetical protein VKV73_26930 [Chloroflexota bacterium]|nr:hypothetical protein [Chloroflexota bacterium]
MQRFEFSTPELALLVQHMTGGAMPLDANAAADLSTTEADLEAAEQQLSERGLLVSAPLEEEVGVASDLATLLSTTLSPDMLGVLRVDRAPDLREVSYFSLTSDCMAHNRVGADGRHVFTEFDTLDELLQAMTATAHGTQEIDAQAEPLDKLLPDSDAVAVLMLVSRPAEPDAAAQVISWVVARGGVWLTDRVGTDGVPLATPIGAEALRDRLRQALQAAPTGGLIPARNGSILHQGGAI